MLPVSRTIWRSLASQQAMEGVFAIHKPTGLTSAQVLRDCQKVFNPSKLFAPWIAAEEQKIEKENHNQRKRRKMKKVQVKIGHGGTLDPLATGVLIAGVGKGTKVLGDFLSCTKTYETIVLFGASTDTQDRTGKILKRGGYSHITKEKVDGALANFRGKIMQLPPLYSALKMDGKPLYEYAREGKPIPRNIEKRQVEVTNIELLEFYEGGQHSHKLPTEEAGKEEKAVAEALWQAEKDQEQTADKSTGEKRKLDDVDDPEASARPTTIAKGPDGEPLADRTKPSESKSEDAGPPAAKIRMTVTSGFYVRSLCHDLGQILNSQATMAELIRSRQGQFELGKNVLEYDDLSAGEDVWGPKVERMLSEWSGDYRPFVASGAKEEQTQVPSEIAKTGAVETVVEDVETVKTEQVAEQGAQDPVKEEPAPVTDGTA